MKSVKNIKGIIIQAIVILVAIGAFWLCLDLGGCIKTSEEQELIDIVGPIEPSKTESAVLPIARIPETKTESAALPIARIPEKAAAPLARPEKVAAPLARMLYEEIRDLDKKIEEGYAQITKFKKKREWYEEHPWKKVTDRKKYKKLKREYSVLKENVVRWELERKKKVDFFNTYIRAHSSAGETR